MALALILISLNIAPSPSPGLPARTGSKFCRCGRRRAAAGQARDALVAVGNLHELGGADDLVDAAERTIAGADKNLPQDGVGGMAAVGKHDRRCRRPPALIVGLQRADPIGARGQAVGQVGRASCRERV